MSHPVTGCLHPSEVAPLLFDVARDLSLLSNAVKSTADLCKFRAEEPNQIFRELGLEVLF